VVIEPLLSNLLTLLITMLRAEAREPRAHAELLQLQLSQLDRFVTSPDDVIRERACRAALALLQEYRALLSGGSARGGGAGGSENGGLDPSRAFADVIQRSGFLPGLCLLLSTRQRTGVSKQSFRSFLLYLKTKM
jgi:hypothetical protein